MTALPILIELFPGPYKYNPFGNFEWTYGDFTDGGDIYLGPCPICGNVCVSDKGSSNNWFCSGLEQHYGSKIPIWWRWPVVVSFNDYEQFVMKLADEFPSNISPLTISPTPGLCAEMLQPVFNNLKFINNVQLLKTNRKNND